MCTSPLLSVDLGNKNFFHLTGLKFSSVFLSLLLQPHFITAQNKTLRQVFLYFPQIAFYYLFFASIFLLLFFCLQIFAVAPSAVHSLFTYFFFPK